MSWTAKQDSVTPKEWPSSSFPELWSAVLRWWEHWGTAATVTAMLVVIVACGLRLYGGWNARRRRRTVLLRPSSKFDPSAEEVLRFCGQLSRVNSATARVTVPRSTRTVRVRLVHAGDGRMAQLLDGPAGAEQILRHRGFAQVELADPDSVMKASPPGSEATQESEAAEPTQTDPDEPDQGPVPGGGADSSDADLVSDADQWLDTEPGEYPGAPRHEVEWLHPEERRLHPVPNSSLWDVLDDETGEW